MKEVSPSVADALVHYSCLDYLCVVVGDGEPFNWVSLKSVFDGLGLRFLIDYKSVTALHRYMQAKRPDDVIAHERLERLAEFIAALKVIMNQVHIAAQKGMDASALIPEQVLPEVRQLITNFDSVLRVGQRSDPEYIKKIKQTYAMAYQAVVKEYIIRSFDI